jgi:hypothetical protein
VPWTQLGVGAYNVAYLSPDRTQVFKAQKLNGDSTDRYDHPERAVRLWNAINPGLKPAAFVTAIAISEDAGEAPKSGWVCPYVDGEQASDDEIHHGLIDIFNSSGRVIVDAPAPKNFIKSKDQVVCVDIGLALQLDKLEECPTAPLRRASVTSLTAWRDEAAGVEKKFNIWSKSNPKSVQTIKALLYIKEMRPDIHDVTFLKGNDSLIKLLANAYNERKKLPAVRENRQFKIANEVIRLAEHSSAAEAKSALLVERAVNLVNIRESCIKELENYINSRGAINYAGIFEPSLTTRMFRNTTLTAAKVAVARQLMTQLKDSSSFEEMQRLIKTAQGSERATISFFSSGMASTLQAGLRIVEIGLHHESKLNHSSEFRP